MIITNIRHENTLAIRVIRRTSKISILVQDFELAADQTASSKAPAVLRIYRPERNELQEEIIKCGLVSFVS